MILSALLTSVGINLGLCFLFFTLYSILRKQPGNVFVYAPRLLENQNSKHEVDNFNLERLLPSADWIKTAWELTEEELLSASGLDALVLVRAFVFSVKVFAFGSIIGIFVLLPVNFFGSQLDIDEFSDITNKSLESFSISNVNNGSYWLWIHFTAAYVFTGVVCYLLYCEYDYISRKRIACFYSSKPQPHQFTILVRGIPSSPGRSYSEIVESFFTEFHPSTYLSHSVIPHTSKIRGLIEDTNKLYRKLVRHKSKRYSQKKVKRDGFLGLFGRQVSLVEHYEKKLEDLEDDVRMKQHSSIGQEVPAAFVSFKSRFGAAVALHIQQGVNPTKWVTERAPEPLDVHWSFFSASFLRRWIYQIVAIVACLTVTILFFIPVVLVQGLANLHQLEIWLPFLKGVLSLKFVSQLITGYLPSLVLQIFLFTIPPMMILFSSMQGFVSYSQIEKSACTKMLLFTIWNIFLANVLSGSAFYMINVFLEPKNILKVLAEAVPAQASFFISYVVTSGWTRLSSELFRLLPLVSTFIKRRFSKDDDDDEFTITYIPYYREIPSVIFFGLLGMTYFFLSPLILPFLLIYFCLGYIIYRNQLMNVYAPKYETGGKFWPIVHSSTIFSLIFMHIIAIGTFGVKELPAASSLLLPLPFLTLIFNDYCRKKFRPLFSAYPLECLIKKDKADEKEANMREFYDKVITAYRDPALMPVHYARNADRRTPLLHTRV
ncbi:ERD (early-responsive to dehydration stress) family protein [Euphorbia peplus]|nr:ERD (early-responsive to dehydration stress) family protein [Euphorbia peplus]